MTRRPAAPANLRNGLKWRDGRPRWEPSPANRACGFVGIDLRASDGSWMERGAATTAADARTIWAKLVREAGREDDAGGKARATLRLALDRLPPVAADPHLRGLVADLIERGRAVLENREPDVTRALTRGPRTVTAMVEGFFADAEAQGRLARSTQRVYRVQARKLVARHGADRADEITRGQMRALYLDIQREISTASANVALGAAGAMFRWAGWQNPPWLINNPCDKIGREKAAGRRVFWTFEEESLFVPWCDANGFVDVGDAVTTCLWIGARQIDVCATTVDDLSGTVRRYVPIKTQRKGQEAVAGLLDTVRRRVDRRRAELLAVHRINPGAAPFLWNPERQGPHDSDTIRDRYKAARAAAIAAGAVPATLATKNLADTRDTCVTRLFAAGVPLDRICAWTGHSRSSAETILKEHYLTLLDQGAIETASELATYAESEGFAVTAA